MMEIVLIVCALWMFDTAVPASLGNITPVGKDGIYLFIGEMLELNCTLNSSVVGSANDLSFDLRNDYLDEFEERISDQFQHRADNLTLQLRRRVESERDAGIYSCWLLCETDTSPCDLVDSVEVAVQWRPQRVQNVSCVMYNWDESLTCQWDLGVQYLDLLQYNPSDVLVSASIIPISYQYGWRPLGSVEPCPSPLNITRKGVCMWKNKNASLYLLRINVTNTQRQESNITIHEVNVSKIAKPSQVQDLWVTGKTSSCVHAEWNHTRVHRPKLFHVQIFRNGDLLQNVTTNSTSYRHCGLNPYTAYVVSVSCKPEQDGYWSEERNITVTTDETEPSQSFPIHPGSYVIHQCGSDYTRNATLYFRSVPGDQRNGEIIGYRLQYNEKQVDVNRDSPFLAVVENVPCDKNLLVHIYARTKVGPSNASSAVLVHKDAAYDLSDFAVELSEDKVFAVWNGSELKPYTDERSAVMNLMSPESRDNHTYTSGSLHEMAVFWCVGDMFHKECLEEIKWKTAPFKAGRIELPALEKDPKNYLFGASVGSQPITWTGCLYQKNAVPTDPPRDLRVVPSHGELDVQRQSRQCSYSYPYHVKGYIVHICQTSNCADTSDNVSIEGGSLNYVSVTASPGIQYNLSVRAVMSSGEVGPWSESKLVQLQSDDSSSYLLTAVGIAMAVVAFIFLMFCGYRFKYCVDSRRAKFQYPLFPANYSRHMIDVGSMPSPNSSGHVHSARTPSTTRGTASVHTDMTYLQQQTVSEEHHDVMAVTYLLPHSRASAMDCDNRAEPCNDAGQTLRSPDEVSPLCCSYMGFEMETSIRNSNDERNAVVGEDVQPPKEIPTLAVTMTPCDITKEEVIINNPQPVPNAAGTDYMMASSAPSPPEGFTVGYVPLSSVIDIQVTSPSVVGHSGSSMSSSPVKDEDENMRCSQLAPRCSCLPEKGNVYTTSPYIPVVACLQSLPQDAATSLRSGHAGLEYLLLPNGRGVNTGAGNTESVLSNTPALHGAGQAVHEDPIDLYVRNAPASPSELSDDAQNDPLVQSRDVSGADS